MANMDRVFNLLDEVVMAHELDRKADRTAAMFSVRQTPWHREGTLLRDAPSLDEALRVGGLDFEIEVRPLYTRVHQNPGVADIFGYRTAVNACATVRTDREAVLGVVSARYNVLQNRDAFGVLEPLLDSGLASLERAARCATAAMSGCWSASTSTRRSCARCSPTS